MVLHEVIEALGNRLPASCGYDAVILSRERLRAGGQWGGLRRFSILDIIVDEDDKDINFVTDEDAMEEQSTGVPLTVEKLVGRLRELEGRCSTWSVFSRSGAVSVDDKYDVRVDVPLVGSAANHEHRVVGLLQWPDEQWREAE